MHMLFHLLKDPPHQLSKHDGHLKKINFVGYVSFVIPSIDFAIKKSNEEIENEKILISKEASVFFEVDTALLNQVKLNHKIAFDKGFFEMPAGPLKLKMFDASISILDGFYKVGVLPEEYNFSPNKIISILIDNTQTKAVAYNQFFPQTNLNAFYFSMG